MRDYGKLQTSFWTSDDIRGLSDDGKLLAAYLLTSSHTTLIGCFRLPDGYVCEDLSWDSKRVSKGFQNLSDNGFITRDSSSSWLLIHKFLKWNEIENPNQGKAALKLFSQVPHGVVKTALALALKDYAKHFPHEELKGFLTVTQTVSQTVSKPVTGTGTVIKEAKASMSGKPDDAPQSSEKSPPLKPQSIEVLEFLNTKASRNYRPTDANIKLIQARIREGYSVQDCKQVIAKKCREWLPKDDMREYLRPATLFNREKFNQYIGEIVEVPDE